MLGAALSVLVCALLFAAGVWLLSDYVGSEAEGLGDLLDSCAGVVLLAAFAIVLTPVVALLITSRLVRQRRLAHALLGAGGSIVLLAVIWLVAVVVS